MVAVVVCTSPSPPLTPFVPPLSRSINLTFFQHKGETQYFQVVLFLRKAVEVHVMDPEGGWEAGEEREGKT